MLCKQACPTNRRDADSISMRSTPTYYFHRLAGIEPGVTTLFEVRELMGDPESTFLSPSYKIGAREYAGGDLAWVYPSHGVRVFVDRGDVEHPNPVVDSVGITTPRCERLTCGLHVGQSLQAAREIIVDLFEIIDEYEDSIYFSPDSKRDLTACVEHGEADWIESIELTR